MWDAVIHHNWIPPKTLTEERYKIIKNKSEPVIDAEYGFIGFGCSYSGKWWGGYCRSNTPRNYTLNAHNSVMKKASTMQGIDFYNLDYKDLLSNLPSYKNMVIYCDIPYKGTTPYCKKEVGIFNHEEFYAWVKDVISKGHKVFVSEYLQNVPDDAIIVWEHQSKKDIRDKNGMRQPTIEVLFTYE